MRLLPPNPVAPQDFIRTSPSLHGGFPPYLEPNAFRIARCFSLLRRGFFWITHLPHSIRAYKSPRLRKSPRNVPIGSLNSTSAIINVFYRWRTWRTSIPIYVILYACVGVCVYIPLENFLSFVRFVRHFLCSNLLCQRQCCRAIYLIFNN